MSEETKKTEEVTTKKSSTWLNRIGSAIVGALIAVGSMLGITSDKIAEQKAKTEEIKVMVSGAIYDLSAGNIVAAKDKLQKAVVTGKEVVDTVKETIKTVKSTDTKEVKEVKEVAVVADKKAKTEKKADTKKADKTKKTSEKKEVKEEKK